MPRKVLSHFDRIMFQSNWLRSIPMRLIVCSFLRSLIYVHFTLSTDSISALIHFYSIFMRALLMIYTRSGISNQFFGDGFSCVTAIRRSLLLNSPRMYRRVHSFVRVLTNSIMLMEIQEKNVPIDRVITFNMIYRELIESSKH